MSSSLINQIFEPKQAKLLSEIYRNESAEGKKIILDVIASQLCGSNTIVLGQELNSIVLLMTQAHFILSEEEPLFIGAMIFYCLKKNDIFPSLIEHTGKDFSSRTLVSLSLFGAAMERKHKKFGAPSPDYYKNVAIMYLKSDGLADIANNFDKWTGYINNRLV